VTSGVPSLVQLAAQRVIANNQDINQLRPVLSNELIDYLRTLSGEIPLELATQFYDLYAWIVRSLAALGDQHADAEIADQFLGHYQQLLLLHDHAAEALTTALAAAVTAPDPQWRQYLTDLLSDVQERVTILGRRAETEIEYFTGQQDAAAAYDNWLDDDSNESETD
jgi:hypothetical protein